LNYLREGGVRIGGAADRSRIESLRVKQRSGGSYSESGGKMGVEGLRENFTAGFQESRKTITKKKNDNAVGGRYIGMRGGSWCSSESPDRDPAKNRGYEGQPR